MVATNENCLGYAWTGDIEARKGRQHIHKYECERTPVYKHEATTMLKCNFAGRASYPADDSTPPGARLVPAAQHLDVRAPVLPVLLGVHAPKVRQGVINDCILDGPLDMVESHPGE